MEYPENDPKKEKKYLKYPQNLKNDPNLDDVLAREQSRLRRLAGFSSDAVHPVRETLDYKFATMALEISGSQLTDPFEKDNKEEKNDNSFNAEVVRPDYIPENRRAVETAVRSLGIAVRTASQHEDRDKLLQRRMAYQLALDDFEHRLACRLYENYAGKLDFSKTGIFGSPDKKPREKIDYDPAGRKGRAGPAA